MNDKFFHCLFFPHTPKYDSHFHKKVLSSVLLAGFNIPKIQSFNFCLVPVMAIVAILHSFWKYSFPMGHVYSLCFILRMLELIVSK